LGKFFKLTDCVIFCCIISIYLTHIHVFSIIFSLCYLFFSLQIHFHYNPQVTIIFNNQFFLSHLYVWLPYSMVCIYLMFEFVSLYCLFFDSNCFYFIHIFLWLFNY
jgi:hypothetical protein